MTEYKCELCNFKTKLKSNFKRHTLTIKHKKNIENIKPEILAEKICIIAPSKTLNFIENIKKKDQNSLKNPHFPSKFPHFPSKNIDNLCEFCGKKFSRPDNLKRHIETTCKKKNEKVMKNEQEIEELKERIDTLIKQGTGNTYNINNVNNSHNTTTNVQQNNTINLNVFGKEDLSMLTDEFKKELIKGPFTMMPKLMEKIYFNEKYPENHTIKMVNKNKDLMKIHNEEGWKLADATDTLDYILEDKNYEVDAYYDLNEEEFSYFVQKTYKKFRKLFDSRDRQLWKKIKREINILLWNNM